MFGGNLFYFFCCNLLPSNLFWLFLPDDGKFPIYRGFCVNLAATQVIASCARGETCMIATSAGG